MVLDTEVYSKTKFTKSNTNCAKFAAGKRVGKKDFMQHFLRKCLLVLRWGANPQQTLLAMREAEAYDAFINSASTVIVFTRN